MKLVPLLLVGSVLGGASWLGVNGTPAQNGALIDERWELGRMQVTEGGDQRAVVVQLQCNGGCAMRIHVVELPPTR